MKIFVTILIALLGTGAVSAWEKDGPQCKNLDKDGRGCDANDCTDLYMLVLKPAGIECDCKWSDICSTGYPFTEPHQAFAYDKYAGCVKGTCGSLNGAAVTVVTMKTLLVTCFAAVFVSFAASLE